MDTAVRVVTALGAILSVISAGVAAAIVAAMRSISF